MNVTPGGAAPANIELAAGIDDAAQTGAVFFCKPRIERSFIHFFHPPVAEKHRLSKMHHAERCPGVPVIFRLTLPSH